MQSRNFGDRGEALVAEYYRQNGYEIVETRYRTRYGEVDLIAQRKEVLVFVEVKSRGAGAIARPCEWVDARKQRRIIMAAQEYLLNFASEPLCRFDVAEVSVDKNNVYQINCIEDAFTL